jgi:PPOX class probable F420-dependent enzyme
MNNATREAARESCVSLTTFRRNGIGVPTPVWAAPSRDNPDELVVLTGDHTGKVKRLKNHPRVELRPCDRKGNVRPDVPTWTGSARIDRSPEGVLAVKRAIGDKYGWWYRALISVEVLVAPLLPYKPRAAIHIVLD